ncbi:bifunctional SulP family inorganic anion transporter/carbonic anhydrase [Streptomyces sp. NPDC052236]|uniref:bifunctional SulP family inorganic anion transporter/carbonic anhydrase n=1 Tax=Streptomyces sp. NPDC052236 TaxID=3365686 RepID=UPI0037D25DF9
MSTCVPTHADDAPRKPTKDSTKHRTSPEYSESSKSGGSSDSGETRRGSQPGDGRRRRRFRIAGADLSASISVFLIALPLSLGIALATGAPLQAGLVAAAVGGIVAGRLGGAPLQVSGPAAGLTVVTADVIQQYGWRATCAITVVAGLTQLALAALRVARSALAVSPAIVHGMLAGIGVTIALAQLHIVLGGTPQSSAIDNVRGLPAQLAGLHPAAISVSALTVGVLLVWPRIPGRAGLIVRKVPAALAAVAGATAFAALVGLSLPRVDLPSWSSHALPALPEGPALALLAAVLTITLVGSVESLLSAVAVDKLLAARQEHKGSKRSKDTKDSDKRKEPEVRIPRAQLDRELAGQGAANIVSGALGGLPVTGVAVRSAANVSAGGVSRNSTMLHGLWIAVAALLLVSVLDLIPLAALAALVMVVGIQMVNITHLRSVKRNRELLVYAVTLASVVLTGVLEGVVIGIAVAVAVALHRLTKTRITIAEGAAEEEEEGAHRDRDRDRPRIQVRVQVRGQLTFLAVPRLSRILGQVPQGAECVVELDGSFMDHAAYEALHDWQTSHVAHGGTVEFTGRAGSRISEPASVTHGCCRPWTPWRNHHCQDRPSHTDTHQLASGLSSFQRNTAPLVREELARLAREGQRPAQLFLTCADSRLVTSMITASGPGDLFTVRNVGNLVPPPGAESSDDSVAAAIEYAVDVLKVDSITICGHSGCGAMQALLSSPPEGAQTPLRRWLRHGMPSLERMRSQHRSRVRISGRLPTDAVEQLCLTNVVQQLEHLRAHEAVARRLAEGTLKLHGMYFHVGEAQAYLLPSSDEYKANEVDEGDAMTDVDEVHGMDEVFDRVAPTPSALERSRA